MTQGRALVLFALLALSGLAGWAPTASAQGDSAICFDHDGTTASVGRVGTTELGARDCQAANPPDYVQGEAVTIRLVGFTQGTVSQLRARCLTGCPSPDPSATTDYYADYNGEPRVFPRDFHRPLVGTDPALAHNATLERAGRYNSTWEIAAMLGSSPSMARTFHVWAADFFAAEGDKVRPGSMHRVTLTGFDNGATVDVRIERRVGGPAGAYQVMASDRGRAGVGSYTWVVHFPKTEGQHIVACGGAQDCYRLVARGQGKLDEAAYFQVAPAEIRRNTFSSPTPSETPVGLERTRDAVIRFDLMFPPAGNNALVGDEFTWADVPAGVGGKRELRVVVEKLYVNDTTKSFLVAELNATYRNETFAWVTNWTPAKDIELEGSAVFRLRVPQGTDVHGNRIRETFLANYTLTRAALRPEIVEQPQKVERTQEVNVTLHVTYINGSNASDADLATPLRGCFLQEDELPAEAPSPCSAPKVVSTEGKFWGEGRWSFTTRYGRDEANLGKYRFHLINGTKDKWQNEVFGAQTKPYELVPAKPIIQFTTVARGAEETVLERGNLVYLNAVIKYADGNAYNHSVRYSDPSVDPAVLQLKLTKRGPAAAGERYGPVVTTEIIEMRETDEWGGRWAGRLQLTDDDTITPTGRWSIELNATDNVTVPNANITVFDRRIVGAKIHVCDVYPQGSTTTPFVTGTQMRWRYRLEYDGCGMGRPVPQERIGTHVVAHVHLYNATSASATGPAVSGVLVPRIDPSSGEWIIEYTIEKHLFNGTYAVAIGGEDAFHNPLARGSILPEFSTRSPILIRPVLTQPSVKVYRGESATAIFEAQPGDTGVDPTRPVRVQLERYFPRGLAAGTCAAAIGGGMWCGEVLDTRVDGYEDHVGVYAVNLDTPVGIYRFALQGRDKDFSIITAITDAFEIEPTSVVRVLYTSPPPQVLKGERFWFTAEFQPGDRYDILSASVWFNGRKTEITGVRLEPRIDILNVSWTVPYDLEPGNYTIRIVGRDLTGNAIEVESPPFETSKLSLTGRIIGSPSKLVKRGETATFIFGVTYPNGAYYLSPASPKVRVLGPDGFTAPVTVRREALTIVGTWTVPPEAPDGDYVFRAEGEATAGNLFPDLTSPPFRTAPGVVTRRTIGDVYDMPRMTADYLLVPRGDKDKSAECKLEYYGNDGSDFLIFQDKAKPISTATIPHITNDKSNAYACTLVADGSMPVGKYRIVFEGVDRYDNKVSARSRAFAILPANAILSWDPFPDSSALQPGETFKLSFTISYANGLAMTGDDGMPGAILNYNGAPVQPKPEVTYEDGRFWVTWPAPDELPPGTYIFTVAGADNNGNLISTASSNGYTIRSEPVESLAKVAGNKIPGAPAAGIIVALAALAIVLRRRTA